MSTPRLFALPGVRGSTLAMILMGALPALVLLLVGLLLWISQRESVAAIDSRVATAANIVAAEARSIVSAHLQVLERVDLQQAQSGDLRSVQLPAPELGVAGLSPSAYIFAFDTDGALIPDQQLSSRTLSIAANPDFRELARGSLWRITPLIQQGPAGGKSFAIGRRVERNGRFAGAMVIYVSADVLLQAWLNLDLGTDSAVSLVRDDGWLVTRFPAPDQGINLASHDLFTRHRSNAEHGVYRSGESPVDHVARTVAYRPVQGLPLLVTASMSESAIDEPLTRRLRSSALVSVPIGAALTLVCAATVVLIRREEKTRASLQEAIAQNRMLMQEIHHRVKNNLQTVMSLIRLQQAPPEARDDLIRRVAAMTAMHQHMYENDQYDSVDVREYLVRLLEQLREGQRPGIEIDAQLDRLLLEPSRLLPLGLIVNEVVSNAFKHAFPDERAGRISIRLEAGPTETVLTISDDGVGLNSARKAGMGSRLIQGFTGKLKGASTHAGDGGYTFRLVFPTQPPA